VRKDRYDQKIFGVPVSTGGKKQQRKNARRGGVTNLTRKGPHTNKTKNYQTKANKTPTKTRQTGGGGGGGGGGGVGGEGGLGGKNESALSRSSIRLRRWEREKEKGPRRLHMARKKSVTYCR